MSDQWYKSILGIGGHSLSAKDTGINKAEYNTRNNEPKQKKTLAALQDYFMPLLINRG